MALSAFALVSLAELKAHLTVSGSGLDSVLELVIDRASDAIEAHLAGELVTRGQVTELYTFDASSEVLQLAQWPVIALATVKEGAHGGGAWTAAATLVEGTDFVVDKAAGRLTRISGGARRRWAVGFESVQVVYRAGYQDAAGSPADAAPVPPAIRDVCLALAARRYSQIKRAGDFDAQSVSNGMGAVSRFLPGELLRMEREALAPFVRSHYGAARARRA